MSWSQWFVMGFSTFAAAGCMREPAETGGHVPLGIADPDLRARFSGRAPLEAREGKAAYYADSLAGRPTASSEPYDPRALTAANRELPFGTIVRVVRPDGRDVYVRINDRGPFGDAARIIDLSRAAAEQIGMIREGVVDVRIEVVGWQTDASGVASR